LKWDWGSLRGRGPFHGDHLGIIRSGGAVVGWASGSRVVQNRNEPH